MRLEHSAKPAWPFPALDIPLSLVERSFDPAAGFKSASAVPGIALPEDLSAAVPSRQAAYLAGRLCAGDALAHAGSAERHVARDRTGMPLWPAGYCGSITHTGTLAGAVVASGKSCRGVGLDFEDIGNPDVAAEIAELVLTDRDRRTIADNPALDAATATLLVFSLKESLYKAISPFLEADTGFEDAEIVRVEDGRAGLRLRRALGPALPEGLELPGVYTLSDDLVRTLVLLD